MNTQLAFFLVFGLTRSGIEPQSSVPVVALLSTRPLTDLLLDSGICMMQGPETKTELESWPPKNAKTLFPWNNIPSVLILITQLLGYRLSSKRNAVEGKHQYRLKRNCPKSVVLKKWEQLEVKKRCRKPCSTFRFICENRFNLFDCVPFDSPAFWTFVTSEKDDFAKYLAE